MTAPGPVAVAQLSELTINHLIVNDLRRRIADAQAMADRRAREAFADGLRRGRRAALGWLFVGAASGFVVAFAVGFAIFW